ncbi:MAG TPA: PEP-CTERM sorting domain-containing protein [Thiobacillus sp.]
MQRIGMRFFLVVLLALAATPSRAVLIDFEGLADGTVVTNQFAGVTFSSNGGNVNQVTAQPGIGFGSNFICTALGSINCSQETILTFAGLASNVSFYQVGDNATGVVALVDVFVNNILASTVNILGFNDFNIPNLVDLTAFSNVTSLRIHSISDPGGLGWDHFNFTLGPNNVPEPSSIALLGLGAISLSLFRRRKII